jgi:hypothetical protein
VQTPSLLFVSSPTRSIFLPLSHPFQHIAQALSLALEASPTLPNSRLPCTGASSRSPCSRRAHHSRATHHSATPHLDLRLKPPCVSASGGARPFQRQRSPPTAQALTLPCALRPVQDCRRRFTSHPESSFSRSLEPCCHIAAILDCASRQSCLCNLMPRSTTSSNDTRSNYSPDRSHSQTSEPQLAHLELRLPNS